MLQHYANVIEELVDEPRLSAEEISRAREAVEERSSEELDQLLADLLENPTVAAVGALGAAKLLYEPGRKA